MLISASLLDATDSGLSDDVISLVDETFEEFIKGERIVLVNFYASWHKEYKAMAPWFLKLARNFNDLGAGVRFSQIDASKQPEIKQRYEVTCYPTLKLFFEGQDIAYDSNLDEKSVRDWLKKIIAILSLEISNIDSLQSFTKNGSAVILTFLKEDRNTFKAFGQLALSRSDERFGYSFSSEVKQALNITANIGLVVLGNEDKDTQKFESDFMSLSEMQSFLDRVQYGLLHPSVQHLTLNVVNQIYINNIPAVIIFTHDKDSEEWNVFTKNADKYADSHLLFVYADRGSEIGARLAEKIGVHSENINSIWIVQHGRSDCVRHRLDTVNDESFSDFISDWKLGKVPCVYKSEPIPKENNSRVKAVVSDTFNDLVFNNDKHVFLLCYVTWDGRSKYWMPIFDEVAESLSHVEDLMFAKIDGYENEHPSVKLTSYPTIKFFKKGAKNSPINYPGGQSIEKIIDFLEHEMQRDLKPASIRSIDNEL